MTIKDIVEKNMNHGSENSKNIINIQHLGLEGVEKSRLVSSEAFAQSIRTLLQNWRQGTVGCKSRGEVAFSNKKPWKQKGTGRARVSSRRSPLWRKGGIIFGPQPRIKTLKANKSITRGVLASLFWKWLEDDRIISLNYNASGDLLKTRHAYNALKQVELHEKRVLLFVDSMDYDTQLSFSNIPNVSIALFDQPNAHMLSGNEYWLILNREQDFNNFKNMVSAWI